MTDFTNLGGHIAHSSDTPRKPLVRLGLLWGLAGLILLTAAVGLCADQSGLQTQWGGHLRAIGTMSWPGSQSIYALSDTDTPYYDGQLEGRLKNQVFLGAHLSMETHYEVVRTSGDTREAASQLANSLAGSDTTSLLGEQDVNDDRRLMNLTHTINEGDGYLFYHRLDRLNVTYATDRITLRMGRQALTWGNGLVFNPMDLFNPFSPTSVQRDYKAGEDMAYLQLPVDGSELQLLYVPRRDPSDGEISEDQYSYAAKWHVPFNGLEFDLMTARHYGDAIVGAGAMGYWGGAAWRLDTVLTLLNESDDPSAFVQIVANIDYAWQWGDKNLYGLLEYYHNGLGYTQGYDEALSDPLIADRLDRGELFTLARDYLAASLNIQWHPLIQTRLAAITNLHDGSGIFQPQLLWDAGTNFQVILGANAYWGNDESEFGGFDTSVASIPIQITPTPSIYAWLTYYF